MGELDRLTGVAVVHVEHSVLDIAVVEGHKTETADERDHNVDNAHEKVVHFFS